MRLKAEDKEKVRRRILASAAAAFRSRGIEAVTLDDLMKGAALTRGAFYAHFPSKGALVADVLENEHPLHRMLTARTGSTPAALWSEMAEIFAGYLSPANLSKVYPGCTLASLTGDAARGGVEHRRAYATALDRIASEMARGLDATPEALLPALVTAAGAVNTAQACADAAMQAVILDGAHAQVRAILERVRP